MGRIDDVLKMKNLNSGAKEEIRDAKLANADLKALAGVAESEGGSQLLDALKEDCRTILLQMLTAKKEGEGEKVLPLLSDFEAKFTLYNTIKSASQDYEDAEKSLDARVDEILEG